MKNYNQIKEQLVRQGVQMDGFGSWLYVRATSDKMNLPKPQYPYWQDRNGSLHPLGVFAYELRWEQAYKQLKQQKIDIIDFAEWLIGVPHLINRDPFTLIGKALTRFGKHIALMFH